MVNAASCSGGGQPSKKSGTFNWVGQQQYTCFIGDYSQLFTLTTGFSLQASSCTLSACSSVVQVSSDSNGKLYSSPSTASCTFTITCDFDKSVYLFLTFLGSSTTCSSTSNNINLSFSSSGSTSKCIFPSSITSPITLNLNQGTLSQYSQTLTAFTISATYFKISPSCNFQDSGGASSSIATFSISQSLQVTTSSALSSNYQIQCSFTDISGTSGLTFQATSQSFKIIVCQYTALTLSAISVDIYSSTSTTQYSLSSLFSMSDISCPTTINSVSVASSSSTQVTASKVSNKLQIQVTTGSLLSITQTYTISVMFGTQTAQFTTGEQSIQVIVNCANQLLYQASGTPSNITYYTSYQLPPSFTSNINNTMKIYSSDYPSANVCTYQNCSISPDTGTQYLYIDNTLSCLNPATGSTSACNTVIIQPSIAVQQRYRYVCQAYSSSSIYVYSQYFWFTYYNCQNTANSTLYSIYNTTPLVYSFNPYSTSYGAYYNFIVSPVPDCIDTASCTFAKSPNDISAFTLQTQLTFTKLQSTYFYYYLQYVNVGTIGQNTIIVSCNLANTSTSSVVLQTSDIQIQIVLNCWDNSTYKLVTSPPSIQLGYNTQQGSQIYSSNSFNNYFYFPSTTCAVTNCLLKQMGSLSNFSYVITQNMGANTTFDMQVQTNYKCGAYDYYKLKCFLDSTHYIVSNQFLMSLLQNCQDITSFSNQSSISDIQVFPFSGTQTSGVFLNKNKQLKFSQFFIAPCYPTYDNCTYSDCQIYTSSYVAFQALNNSAFTLSINTGTPQYIAGLQLKCNLISGNILTQIISNPFNVIILCSPINSSVSTSYPSLPAYYNVSVATPNKITLNNVVTLNQYATVTDPTYCSNIYYTYKVVNGNAAQNAILTFNSITGQLQIYNSQQFIYQIQFAIVVNGISYNFTTIPWLNQTCQANSTVVSKPQTFTQLQLFVVNQYQTPTFTFNSFLTSNPCCLIQSYKISGLNVNSLNLLNNNKVLLNNPALNLVYASYLFQITATAQGGAFLTLSGNLTVVPDCTLEKIFLNPVMPDSISDENYRLYKQINGLPMLVVNQSSKDTFETDISKRFYSLNDYNCKFINYKIKQVLGLNDKGVYAQLSPQNYSSYFRVNNFGVFKIQTPLSTNYTHYFIYLIAENIGNVWGGDSQQYLIDSSVYPYINPLLVDNKAYFLWDPQSIVIDLLTVQNRTVQYILPAISSATNKIIFDNTQYPFITQYQDKYLGLYFIIDLNNKTFYNENFTIHITLQNTKNGNYKAYKIPLQLVGNETLSLQGKYKKYNCSATVKISQTGIMTIKFNESMQNEFKISYINQSNTNIELIPALQRDLDVDFDPSQIAFNWTAISLIDNLLVIDLNFSYPQAISPLNEQDNIILQFNGSQIYLYGAQSKLQLGKSYWILNTLVPRQISGNSLQGQAQAGKTLMMAILAVGLFLKMLGSKSDEYLLLMIRPLQIILHLPTFQVIFPINAMTFVKIVIKIAQFDILESFWNWNNQNFLSFDPNNSNSYNQLNNLGYDYSNSLINLSTVGFVVIIYWIRLLVFSIFKLFLTITKGYFGGQKMLKLIKGELFFGMLLEVTLEGYLEFAINGYVNLTNFSIKFLGDIFGLTMSCFCVFMDAIFLPFVILWINIFKNKYDLKKKSFKERWGVIYEGYKYNNKYKRLYTLYFVARRMLFVALGFIIQNYKLTGVQIIFNMFMNLFALIFVGSIQAQVTRIKNRIELMNELYVVLAGVMLPSFTQMTISVDLQQQYGQLYIYIVVSFLCINLFFIMRVFYSSIKLIASKINNFLKVKYNIDLSFSKNKNDEIKTENVQEMKQQSKDRKQEIFNKILSQQEQKMDNDQIELKEIKPRIKGLSSKQKQINNQIIKKSKIVNMTIINESKNESLQSINQSINQKEDKEDSLNKDQQIDDQQAHNFIQVYKKYKYIYDVPGEQRLARDHVYLQLNEKVGPFVFNQSDNQQETEFKLKKLISIAKNNVKFSKNLQIKKELKELESQLKELAQQNITANTRVRI